MRPAVARTDARKAAAPSKAAMRRLHRLDHGSEPGLIARAAFGESLGQGDHADGDRQPGVNRRRRQPARGLFGGVRGSSTQDSSVEPPPTSSTSAALAARSIRSAQPATDSRASSRGGMISSRRPVSSKTCLQERRAVLGRAAGLGGDGPDVDVSPPADALGADLQRGQGALHGGGLEPAGLGQPLAQPHDARIGVDHPETAAAAARGDQQSAVVGAQVQRGEQALRSPPAAPFGSAGTIGAAPSARRARVKHEPT